MDDPSSHAERAVAAPAQFKALAYPRTISQQAVVVFLLIGLFFAMVVLCTQLWMGVREMVIEPNLFWSRIGMVAFLFVVTCAIAFALGTRLMFAWRRLKHAGPSVEVSDEGLRISLVTEEVLPWSALTRVDDVTWKKNPYISLAYEREKLGTCKPTHFRVPFESYSQADGEVTFFVLFADVARPLGTVADEIVEEWRKAAWRYDSKLNVRRAHMRGWMGPWIIVRTP